ncbi:MAG: hypothetical protein R3E10_06835 [Gemmatimonadota bacterium]
MSLTIEFRGPCLFDLANPGSVRVLLPAAEDAANHPDHATSPANVQPHYGFLFVRRDDLISGTWDELVTHSNGELWCAIRLGADDLGDQIDFYPSRGSTNGSTLQNAIARASRNGHDLKLSDDPSVLAAEFELPAGSLTYVLSSGSSGEPGEWDVGGIRSAALPWTVRWTSVAPTAGMELQIGKLADPANVRTLRLANAPAIEIIVMSIDTPDAAMALEYPRLSPCSGTGCADHDFKWMYRCTVDPSGAMPTTGLHYPVWIPQSAPLALRAALATASAATMAPGLPTCFPGGFW